MKMVVKMLPPQMNEEYKPWDYRKLTRFATDVARFSFWFAATNFLLHFFYFSAIQFDLPTMEKLDAWTLCGICYTLGQFFHLKYVVFYGFPKPFIEVDGVESPLVPRCVGRIHLYSDMWRFFDNGLYRFIHKYESEEF